MPRDLVAVSTGAACPGAPTTVEVHTRNEQPRARQNLFPSGSEREREVVFCECALFFVPAPISFVIQIR